MMLSLLISDSCALLYEKSEIKRFDVADKKELSVYLMSKGQAQIKVFVDSIEETHLVERTPVMSVFDAGALHQRLLKKHFKRSGRTFSVMDKNHHLTKKNQKQSKHLLSGFSNDKEIDEWILAIQKTRCLLSGIYSLPLALPLLFNDLDVNTRFSLIVYKNNDDVYRHAFFDGEYLEFSRVVHNLSGRGDDVMQSLKETLMFIKERTKGSTIGVHFIGGANMSSATLHKIDVDAIKSLNVSEVDIHEHQFNTADQFILDKVQNNKKLINHYASQDELSDLNTYTVNKIMCWAVIAVLGVTALFSTLLFYQTNANQKKLDTIQDQTQILMRSYEEKTSAQKNAQFDPRQIAKGVQQVECMRAKEFRTPKYAFLQISDMLLKYKTIAPISITWVNKKDDLLECIKHVDANKVTPPKKTEISTQNATFEMTLQAKILSPYLTPRQINELVSNMAKEISEQPWVTHVSILSIPYSFDSNSSITMTGDDKSEGDIEFSLKISGR